MYGDIMRISRIRMATDGSGVSTLVAFWGCPLRCKYCINDQCHDREGNLNDTIRGAYSPEELIKVVCKDDLYFKMTGGGIVFGGGEPLLQPQFIHEVCELADPAWYRRIETSLNANWKDFRFLVDDIDEWIIDIKDMNSEIYKKYTGKSNERVVCNLKMLIKRVPSKKIWIRVPHIPGYNKDEDVEKSIRTLRELGFRNIDEFVYESTHFVKIENKGKREISLPGIIVSATPSVETAMKTENDLVRGKTGKRKTDGLA